MASLLNGENPTDQGPVFFCRPTEDPFGVFSQWYENDFEVDGVVYSSAEMWMMVQKAKLFGDEVCRCRTTKQATSPIDV